MPPRRAVSRASGRVGCWSRWSSLSMAISETLRFGAPGPSSSPGGPRSWSPSRFPRRRADRDCRPGRGMPVRGRDRRRVGGEAPGHGPAAPACWRVGDAVRGGDHPAAERRRRAAGVVIDVLGAVRGRVVLQRGDTGGSARGRVPADKHRLDRRRGVGDRCGHRGGQRGGDAYRDACCERHDLLVHGGCLSRLKKQRLLSTMDFLGPSRSVTRGWGE